MSNISTYKSYDQLYTLQSIYRHIQQNMCHVTYLVHVYVDSNMFGSVKVSFTDICILTSSMIEKDHSKDVSQIEHIVKQ